MSEYIDEKVYPSEFMLMVISKLKNKQTTYDMEGFANGFDIAKEERLTTDEMEHVEKIFRRGKADVIDSLNSLESSGHIEKHIDDEGTWLFRINEQSLENKKEDIEKLEQTSDENVAYCAGRIAETFPYIAGVTYTPHFGGFILF